MDPLALDREVMRELGYRVVNMLVDRLTDDSAPPLRRATPAEMAARLGGPPPARPTSFEAILEQLDTDVLPFASRGDHPGFFAFIPFSATWPGALGDLIASACNIYSGSWMEAAGPSQVELEVLGWFKEWLDYPRTAAGLLVTGGSAANMTALACARETLVGAMRDDLVVYVSDQAHSSLARAARHLGFRPEQVRVLPVDDEYRLRPERVEAAISADERRRRRPLLVCANAGTTNTGAIDPLAELGEICRRRDLWSHVDAAYGGFAGLTQRGRTALRGIEQADTITLDPHKWLYQPYECGCLLVRDAPALQRAFSIRPDYVQEAAADAGEVDFSDLGMQLTRSARALKLWVSLRYFGIDAFRAAIDRVLDLADLTVRRIETSPSLELAAPPSLGVVCFRRRFEADNEDDLNAGLVAALEASGLGLVSSTRLRGRYAIRMCILSHTSGPEDVERVLSFLETADSGRLRLPRPVIPFERYSEVRTGWLGPRDVEPPLVARHPLFQSLGDDQARRVASLAREREVEAGETIVEDWDTSRDFYAVLSGSVDVIVAGRRIAGHGPGGFFGEIAALDWGGGFGYPRVASVVAVEPTRLLVFPEGTLKLLMSELPALDRTIREAVGERLPHG